MVNVLRSTNNDEPDEWPEYETVGWTCPFCRLEGCGVSNNERHLINTHWWNWVRYEAAGAYRDATDVWVCRLCDACRPCRSERSFRGHLWHKHRWDWLDAWSCVNQ